MTFDAAQTRVLGTLIEKEIVTPEAYPLSLNALTAGCNQKTSRDPVMELSETEVRDALQVLEEHRLTSVVRDARVPKFEHRARTVFQLRRDETAILCLLLLRGPQTPAELRARAERMYSFDDTAAVESALARLTATSTPETVSSAALRPLVTALERSPGTREVRYTHLLGGPIHPAAVRPHSNIVEPLRHMEDGSREVLANRVAELETQMAALRSMMNRLEERIASESGGDVDANSGRSFPEE